MKMVKTRTFILTKKSYSREEVMDIITQITNEARQLGLCQYDEIYVEDVEISVGDGYYTNETDLTLPEMEVSYTNSTLIPYGVNYKNEDKK